LAGESAFAGESSVSLVEAIDQAADHSCDDFELLFESNRCGLFDKAAPAGYFQKRNTLLNGAASDREKIPSIRFCEAAVSLGEIRSY